MQGRDEKDVRHLVFVYGTLKSGERFNRVLTDATNGRASLVGPARTVKKWPLVLMSSHEIPCLLPYEGVGHEVLGEVYEVDDRMLAFLDCLESHSEIYARSLEDVELLSQQLPAGTEADSAPNCHRPPSKAPGDISHSMYCRKVWIYMMRRTEQELLSLPHISKYTGKGAIELPLLTAKESRRFLSAQLQNVAKTNVLG